MTVRYASFRHSNASKEVPKAISAAFAQFEKAVGGREALISVLSMADQTPEIDQVLSALDNPDNDRLTLAELCYVHKLQPGTAIVAYHKAQMQMVQVLAVATVTPLVPKVIEEIVRLALPRTEKCVKCGGKGKIPGVRRKKRGRIPMLICQLCQGIGTKYFDGSGAQQDKVLDLARLISKTGGGVNVAVQTNNNAPAPSGGGTGTPLGQLQQAVQATLSRTPSLPAPDGSASEPRTVDAVVIPEPDPEGAHEPG